MSRLWIGRVAVVVIGVAVVAGMFIESGTPAVAQAQGFEADSATGGMVPGSIAAAPSQPLRWRVAFATVEITAAATFCASSIVVRNLNTSTTSVQVEWYNDEGTSLVTLAGTVPANGVRHWWPDGVINIQPYGGNGFFASLGDFDGSANVFASDPRILVTSHMVCRTATGLPGTVLSSDPIHASPVGATLTFFKAGIPGAGEKLANESSR